MPLHMRMPKHGFKSRKNINNKVFKTDFINHLYDKKVIKEKSSINIFQICEFIKAKQNTHIKLLMGKKLKASFTVEVHAASSGVMKEFKRVGGEIKIINFKDFVKKSKVSKRKLNSDDKVKKEDNLKKVSKPKSKKVIAEKTKKSNSDKLTTTNPKTKVTEKKKLTKKG